MTEDWKTSTIAYETDKITGYLIGYFRNLKQAHNVKQEIGNKFHVDVIADIRLVGRVPRKKGEKADLDWILTSIIEISSKARNLSKKVPNNKLTLIVDMCEELHEQYEALRKQKGTRK